jgi:hypothetical protein
MRFNLPEQNTTTATSTPSNPRKLKKLLSTMPNSNMGELTKQIYRVLRQLNRQSMPEKHRLENMEMLRPFARTIFNNLQKHFINRTLPLPEKSLKIVNLYKSLLQEIIFGYEIIVHEAASNINPGNDSKTPGISICRALSYLSEMLLRCSQVYHPYPDNLWHDAHQLYKFAETRNLVSITVIDTETKPEETTIENRYKQLLLFALAKPDSLSQNDCGRIHKALNNWSPYAIISDSACSDQIDNVFCMRLDKASPPDYLTEQDLAADSDVRTLDTANLLIHIKTIIEEKNKQQQEIVTGDALSTATLKRLLNTWGTNTKRHFSRINRHHERINVAIGLSDIVNIMLDAIEEKEIIATSKHYFRALGSADNIVIDSTHDFFQTADRSDFNLTEIDTDKKRNQPEYVTTDRTTGGESDPWEMVARGRVLTETYDHDANPGNNRVEKPHSENTAPYWEISNFSAGGYRLRWNSKDSSKAQIGELIALQEIQSDNSCRWNIGAIRWMRSPASNQLEIGIQILSPQVKPATVQRASRMHEKPFEALLLPEIKALNQSASIILPSHAFKSNNKLVVDTEDDKLEISLGNITEQTGSYTQFPYETIGKKQQTNSKQDKTGTRAKRDDYDELWSSL